ncbi:MAG: hypothetical protein ACI9WU_004942 [Myxococcota bacterium]|jgi:uncharacterized protein YndB with AHSA1/START domain
MSTITVSRNVAQSPSQVWAVLADFGGVHRFSAGVERSPINAGKPDTGVGAERNCQLYDGNHIQERITEFLPEQRLALEVFDTSMPIKTAGAAFDLASSASGGTAVTMTMDYVVKFGPLGVVMDALMMKRAMTTSLDRLLAGLDYHLTSGATISKGWRPDAAKAV